MGKSAPKAPAPVDPVALANAQGQSNIETAKANQTLNMVNAYGPDGSVTYAADPGAPGGYSQTTTLSPTQQGIYDAGNQAQLGALGIANQQIPRISEALGQQLNSPQLQTSLGNTGNIQSNVGLQGSYDGGGNIQRSIGPTDFTKDREDATNAVWQQAVSRLAPQYGQMQTGLDTRLANQGIGLNSAAYGNAQDNFGRQVNDAYNQAAFSAVRAGSDQQQRLFDQSLQHGNFVNSAQAQQNAQNAAQAAFANQSALTGAQFANQAQQQQYLQQLQAAQFGNQAMGQQFQQDAYAQNQPINQFNSLMSSSQVGMPQGIGYTPASVANTDVIGANALSAQQQQAAYQAKMQQQNGLMGGLFSLGSAAITASDVRLKRDIEKIGERPDGLGVYAYRYLWSPLRHIGVMAQEVLWVKPEAVLRMSNGFYAVDYGKL